MENKSFILTNLDYQGYDDFYTNKNSPYMLLEDNKLVLYFDEGIFNINFETGDSISRDLKEIEYSYDYFCFLENNKFIIYSNKGIILYKFENNKINEIKNFGKENLDIQTIFKLFKGEYILIKFFK